MASDPQFSLLYSRGKSRKKLPLILKLWKLSVNYSEWSRFGATGFIYHSRITMVPVMDTHLLIEAKLRQWWSKCSARWWVGTQRPHTPEHGEINIRCGGLTYYHVSLYLSSRVRMNVYILLDHNLPEYNKCFHQ